jgi:hypothetical protein
MVLSVCLATFLIYSCSAFASAESDTTNALEKWQEVSTPSHDHEWLAKWAGQWNTTSKAWMVSPDQAPIETKGSNSMEMIYGGRFLKVDGITEALGISVQGVGYYGFDNSSKEYTMMWIDNMGTAMTTARGTRSGDVMTLTGEINNIITGEQNVTVKYVYNIQNSDHPTIEVWNGSEKMFEEHFTRIK